MQLLDSFGVEASGNVCVATLINGGITVISPDGELVEFVETGDPLTTNICWGGEGPAHRLHHAVAARGGW